LYRAINRHGCQSALKRDPGAAKRFVRKMLKNEPLLAPDRIGEDRAGPHSPAIMAARKGGLLPHEPLHYITKHMQQGIESDHSHGHIRGQRSGLGVHGSSPAFLSIHSHNTKSR
jgi:transposase, IS6 family